MTSYAHDYPDAHEFHTEHHGLAVSVSKVGGGTLGRAYPGAWHYLVTPADGSTVAAKGSDFETGTHHTHAAVAAAIADLFADRLDS